MNRRGRRISNDARTLMTHVLGLLRLSVSRQRLLRQITAVKDRQFSVVRKYYYQLTLLYKVSHRVWKQVVSFRASNRGLRMCFFSRDYWKLIWLGLWIEVAAFSDFGFSVQVTNSLTYLIISAKEVMFSPVLCLSVCLSVNRITPKLRIKSSRYFTELLDIIRDQSIRFRMTLTQEVKRSNVSCE